MRLADKAVFGALLRSRDRSQSGPLMLQMLPGKVEFGRLGMAVAKRHAKRAVERNLLKRLLRESFRQHGLSHRPVDLVVSLRAGWPGGTTTAARKNLRQHIGQILEQAERKGTRA
jgi:ribonuclease P protein component